MAAIFPLNMAIATVLLLRVLFGMCQETSEITLKKESGEKNWMYFPDGDGIPRLVFLTRVPSPRIHPEEDITFKLYTRTYPDGKSIYVNNAYLLRRAGFNSANSIKFIIHGWKSSGNSSSMTNIKDAYLSARDVNVIIVDWSGLSSSIFYLGPVANTKPVGKYIGRMIRFLISQNSSLAMMHIVGHSLGAHVAGFAGASLGQYRIARITGLDPARPGFPYSSTGEYHLDMSDAGYVDIIHTCGGVLGYSLPIGHDDFYPNRGEPNQPGCCCFPLFAEACSHSRAHEFFTESIGSSSGFRALRCDSWLEFQSGKCQREGRSVDSTFMGDTHPHGTPTTDKLRGIYFLETNADAPFARG